MNTLTSSTFAPRNALSSLSAAGSPAVWLTNSTVLEPGPEPFTQSTPGS